MTPVQRSCLDAIRRLTVRGVAPSYDEIADAMGLASKGRVARLIDELESEGLVRRKPNIARSLTVIGDHSAYTPAALAELGTQALDDLIAHAAGVRAHRSSGELTDRMLRRIGDRLVGRPRIPA